MKRRVVCWLVSLVGMAGFAGDITTAAEPEPPKDVVNKGKDGWYTVEFVVGEAKCFIQFPGEPKRESDVKKTDERVYTWTTKKTQYVLKVYEGNEGRILPERDPEGQTAEVILLSRMKTDPFFKDAKLRRAQGLKGGRPIEFNMSNYQGFILVGQGCMAILYQENPAFSPNEDRQRFFNSLSFSKVEAPKVVGPKRDVPKGWIEHSWRDSTVKLWAPVQLKSLFRREAEGTGDYMATLQEGKTKRIEFSDFVRKDAKSLDGFRNNITAMVPKSALKSKLGNFNVIMTYKDDKPVGKDVKRSIYSFIDNHYITIRADADKLSQADAELMFLLYAEQLQK